AAIRRRPCSRSSTPSRTAGSRIITSSSTMTCRTSCSSRTLSRAMWRTLRGRMEVIRREGYTEDEKVEVARRHLIPKQMEAHGVKDGELTFADEGLRGIIRHYTREAGVRTLERELTKVARKSLRQILEGKT